MSNIRSKDVIYTLIARKGKPLADYTDKRGSFDKFTKDVLQKLSPKPGQYILDYGKAEYIYLINPEDDDLVFLILVEKGYKKETGFALLNKLRSTFIDMFSKKRIKNARSYSLGKEFKTEIQTLIELFSTDSFDKADEAINVIGELRDETTKNLQKLLERDEKFDNLLKKADDMNHVTVKMKKKTVKVKRQALWSSVKVRVALVLIAIVSGICFIGILGFAISDHGIILYI